MNHHTVFLKRPSIRFIHEDSFAMLSASTQVSRAAFFVHGFGGHPVKTFSQAKELIETDANWYDTDAYFVGYNSTGDETMLTAAYLAAFIRSIAPQPPDELFRVFAPAVSAWFELRDAPTRYEAVQIVGHSLGGVIVRAAILLLLRNGLASIGPEGDITDLAPDFLLPCEGDLCLFAPAQGGARIAGLLGLISNIVGIRALVQMYQGKSPTFQELSSGSLLLQQLMDDTNHYADRYPTLKGLRARIAWAHHDSVVTALPYRHDSTATFLDTDHMTVCKPHEGYRTPFHFVSGDDLSSDGGVLL